MCIVHIPYVTTHSPPPAVGKDFHSSFPVILGFDKTKVTLSGDCRVLEVCEDEKKWREKIMDRWKKEGVGDGKEERRKKGGGRMMQLADTMKVNNRILYLPMHSSVTTASQGTPHPQ